MTRNRQLQNNFHLYVTIAPHKSDILKTVYWGKRYLPRFKRLSRPVLGCTARILKQRRGDCSLYDIGYKVQTHAEANGYGVVRALTGHGIGRSMHEDPAVPNYGKAGTGVRLKSGMTICIEPMINMGTYKVNFSKEDGWTVTTADGLPAAHYENTVLITDDGVEILTL